MSRTAHIAWCLCYWGKIAWYCKEFWCVTYLTSCEFVLLCSIYFSAADVTSGDDEWRHTRVRSRSSSHGRLLRPTPSPALASGVCRFQPYFAGASRRPALPNRSRQVPASRAVAQRLLGLFVHALWRNGDVVVVRGEAKVPRDHTQSRWRQWPCRQGRTTGELPVRNGRLRRLV